MKQYQINAVRVFISCSTKQKELQSLIREVVSKYNTKKEKEKKSNKLQYVFFVYNYQDISSSQGVNETMQERYNKFVRDEADAVFAFFDNFVGEGTLQECEAAKTSIRHPLLYIHKPEGTIDRPHYQYQSEFENFYDLRNMIQADLDDIINQIENNEIQADLDDIINQIESNELPITKISKRKQVDQYNAFNAIIQQAEQLIQ